MNKRNILVFGIIAVITAFSVMLFQSFDKLSARQQRTDNQCIAGKNSDGSISYNIPECFAPAEHNDPEAMHALGLAYLSGTDVKIDKQKAFYWLSKSAKAGNSLAQIHLAMMYDRGEGIPEDNAEAFAWLTTAQQDTSLGYIPREAIKTGLSLIPKEMNKSERSKAMALATKYIQHYAH